MQKGLVVVAVSFLVAFAAAGGALAVRHADQADLAVEIDDVKDPVPLARASYRVLVTNRGPDRAARVVVRFRPPPGRSTIGVPSGCFVDRKGNGCARAGLLPRRTWQLRFSVARCEPGRVVATATVSAATPDPRRSNNIARESTTIVPGPLPPPPPSGFGGC